MGSLLTLDELLSAVKGELVSKETECCFSSVQTDSRLVQKDTLFVPLIGEFQDGHKYVEQAIEKGASVVLMDRYIYGTKNYSLDKLSGRYPYVTLILVDNTLHALQNAAEAYVNKVCKDMIKVCITGSSGKTTTKELMVSVAKAYYGDENVAYTKGNFNSETGLPLSVFCIKGTEKIGIFEMGMNRKNEIGEISKVFKANYGIITNIGTAHIGILGSRKNIAEEKRKAFDYITETGAAFVPAADDFADFCTEKVKGKIIKYGPSVTEAANGVKLLSDDGLFGTTFALNETEIHLPLTGTYNYSNALAVVACARELGISVEAIKAGIENMKSVSGRMDISKTALDGKNIIVLKDFYNANPDSMEKALDFCGGLKDYHSKIFVLADMKELGKESKKAHAAAGKKVVEIADKELNSVINVILIGPEMKAALKVLNGTVNIKKLFWIKDNDEKAFDIVCREIKKLLEENSVILFKGSHSMKLEALCEQLLGAQNG